MVVHEDHVEIRDQEITIRVSRRQRSLIDQAARVVNKSRTEFILDSASREAENVLLDQVYFRLDAESYARFSSLLEALTAPSPDLQSLLNAKAPWD